MQAKQIYTKGHFTCDEPIELKPAAEVNWKHIIPIGRYIGNTYFARVEQLCSSEIVLTL